VRATLSGEGSMEPVIETMRAELGSGLPLIFRRGPSTGNRVMPAAGAEFTRAERVRLELPVAAATRPGTARLLDAAGNALKIPVKIGEKTDPDTGQHWITADVVLAPLAAGDYAIEQAPEGMEKVITAVRVTR
jgi:hypothetical protein